MQRSQDSTGPGMHRYREPLAPLPPIQPPLLGATSATTLGSKIPETDGLNRLQTELPLIRLLVVDDDKPLRKICCQIASEMGFVLLEAGSVPEALAVLNLHRVDMLLLDLKLPGGDGSKLISEVKALYPNLCVVVMTGYATVPSAVEAMRTGASDYLTKPFTLEKLTAILDDSRRRLHRNLESRKLRERMRKHRGVGDLIGTSPAMERVYRILSRAANSTHPLLIMGESGTGKELIAREIHHAGRNAQTPFISVDCQSVVTKRIGSELFGCGVNRTLPVAHTSKEGILAAEGGRTVFFDEIGALSLDLQSQLLHALQEKAVHPAGEIRTVPLTARVLAATSRDLNSMIRQGLFRKDLYYRLNVVNLTIPPLRERIEDIPILIEYFLQKRPECKSGDSQCFSEEAIELMTNYGWPGNFRELQYAIEHACAMTSQPVLHVSDLPAQLRDSRRRESKCGNQEDDAVRNADTNLDDVVVSIAAMERQAILGTISQLKGDKLMAARLLGIGKTTLYRRLKEYGLTNEAKSTDG